MVEVVAVAGAEAGAAVAAIDGLERMLPEWNASESLGLCNDDYFSGYPMLRTLMYFAGSWISVLRAQL